MESVSRISSLLETARDLTLEAARDAGPRKSTRPLPAVQVKKLLDSRNEREVLDGLRRVIVMQYATPPQPTLTFFPAVLKTLSNPFPSTRPLVYNYLLHHAELDPDTALLAINTIQKSLSDTNPRVRAMALKTMSGIRVPVISQIVSLAIKKGTSDLSPIVRKAAAVACVKCVRLDPNTLPQIEEYLRTLLADDQYYVAGAAVQAFMEVCPERLDLIHPVYRKLCKMTVDMDEWSQLALIRLMTNYARLCFPPRARRVKRLSDRRDETANFYEDLEPEDEVPIEYDEVEVSDPDLDLFLNSLTPLLSSRNSAVVVAVSRAYLYLSPTRLAQLAVGPLVALLRSPEDIRQVALYNIVQICLVSPEHLVPYFRHFLIRSAEGPEIWQLKLEALSLVFPSCASNVQDLILAELEHFSKDPNPDLVRESVRALGRCAQSPNASTSRRCLSLLLKQIHSPDANLVGEAMEVVRHLIQRSPDQHRKTVIRLAKNLDTLSSKTARASIIWLVGEFAGLDPENNVAADVLRILLKGYADESEEVRAQIILLATKVYLYSLNTKNEKQKALDGLNSTTTQPAEDFGEKYDIDQEQAEAHDDKLDAVGQLYEYAMLLARYTPSYDLRDRARLFRGLLAIRSSTELASLLLFAPKPVPQAPFPSEKRKGYALGSASLIACTDAGIGGLPGYERIPDWVKEGDEPDPKLRDTGGVSERGYVPEKSAPASQRLDDALLADPGHRSAQEPRKEKSLDAWLDESDEEDDEDEDEEESSDEESDESSLESESEEDDDDEEDEDEDDESEEDEKAGLVRK